MLSWPCVKFYFLINPIHVDYPGPESYSPLCLLYYSSTDLPVTAMLLIFFISLLMCRWHFVNVVRKKQQLVQQFFVKSKIGKWVKYHYYGIYIVCCMSATCTFLVA